MSKEAIGQFSLSGIGCKTRVKFVIGHSSVGRYGAVSIVWFCYELMIFQQ